MQPAGRKPWSYDTSINFKPIEEQIETESAVLSPVELSELEEASQLAEWAKRRAELLHKVSTKSTYSIDPMVAQRHEIEHAKRKGSQTLATIKRVVDETLELTGSIRVGAELIGNSINMNFNENAFTGVDLALNAADELSNGLNFISLKWEVRKLKGERAELSQKIDNLDENTERASIWIAQKVQLNKQIAQKEKIAYDAGIGMIKSHIVNTASIFSHALKLATDTSARIAAASGGIVLNIIGLFANIKGVITGAQDVAKTNQLIGKLKKVKNEPGPDKVSEAFNAVKNAALDHTAHHQKTQIKIGIFQNTFSSCSNILGVAGGAIGIAALAGASISTAGLAFTGIGLPVVTGLGLLVAGGIAIYTHRHTIARGIKGLIESREGKRGRFDLERNLSFRHWRVKGKLTDTVKKLDRLAQEHAQVKKSASEGSTPEQDERIQELSQKILAQAGEQIKLTKQLEEIKYKKATQSLRDRATGSPETNSATKETTADVLVEAINGLSQDQLNDFVDRCITSFPGIKFDKLNHKRDKYSYIKTQIQKAITKETFF